MAKYKYGLIGHPVKHSLSPAMQGAAFRSLGIDAEYILCDVEEGKVDSFLSGAASAGFSGLNVTVPHKIKAKEYLERNGTLDQNARRLGAVNTIKISRDGSLWGYNTDGPGFYRSLVEDLKFEPEGKNIFVLGSGGAASAVIMYLGGSPAKIFVFDVDENKTAALHEHYKEYYSPDKLIAVDGGKLNKTLGEADLLVNATPVGLKETDPSPVDVSLLRPGCSVYDLVYNRPMTELVKRANAAKLHAVTGLGMLLYQGAIAFEIWMGKEAPVKIMREALKGALKG